MYLLYADAVHAISSAVFHWQATIMGPVSTAKTQHPTVWEVFESFASYFIKNAEKESFCLIKKNIYIIYI